MLRIVAVLMICLLLPGCATLTVAAIGGAVALGLVGGGAKYAGERITRGSARSYERYRRHIAFRRCQHLRHDWFLLESCVRRYAPEYF